MTHALSYMAHIDIETCCVCGSPIALANMQNLLASKAQFFCPNGHSQSYSGNAISKLEAEVAKQKAEVAREKQRREMAEREAAMESKRAERAMKAMRRIEKRVNNGVCPCCNRTFQNLARHMKTKHPEQEK